MSAKPKVWYRFRSSITGHFIRFCAAMRWPKRSQREKVRR